MSNFYFNFINNLIAFNFTLLQFFPYFSKSSDVWLLDESEMFISRNVAKNNTSNGLIIFPFSAAQETVQKLDSSGNRQSFTPSSQCSKNLGQN